MARTGRDERHELLKKRIEENPFINDEELAEEFSVSIATIRLDRMALGIPELRIRIKQRAVAAGPETKLSLNRSIYMRRQARWLRPLPISPFVLWL